MNGHITDDWSGRECLRGLKDRAGRATRAIVGVIVRSAMNCLREIPREGWLFVVVIALACFFGTRSGALSAAARLARNAPPPEAPAMVSGWMTEPAEIAKFERPKPLFPPGTWVKTFAGNHRGIVAAARWNDCGIPQWEYRVRFQGCDPQALPELDQYYESELYYPDHNGVIDIGALAHLLADPPQTGPAEAP